MNFLSICSGIEAASVAFDALGFKAVGFSEIEPFPCNLLAYHYPEVTNFGDMNNYKNWKTNEPIELIIGGTPCQAFSVAGQRASLSDERGNLSLTFCNLVHHFNPDWVIWENVPGALSTSDNAFGCFLAGLVGEDSPFVPDGGSWPKAGVVTGPKRTAAWRILDAQYFGVAQRRRRIFVLSSAGSGDWRCASALFPLPEGSVRDYSQSAPSRQVASPTAAEGSGTSGSEVSRVGKGSGGNLRFLPQVAGSLDTECGGGKLTHQSAANGHLILEETEVMGTLTARMFNALGARDIEEGAIRPVVMGDIPKTFAIQGSMVGRSDSAGPQGSGVNEDVSFTLNTSDRHCAAYPDDLVTYPLNTMNIQGRPSDDLKPRMGMGIGGPHDPSPTLTKGHSHAVAYGLPGNWIGRSPENGGNAVKPMENISPNLTATDRHAVAYENHGTDSRVKELTEGVCPTVTSRWGTGGNNIPLAQTPPAMKVRKLTPLECERLQGFPDGYTNIQIASKSGDHPDAGLCAKQVVKATVVLPSGRHIVGTNACMNPQKECPRELEGYGTGEGYHLCREVCEQQGHAEEVALKAAGKKADGSVLYVEGHDRVCLSCFEEAQKAGVKKVVLGKPPGNAPEGARYKALGNSMATPVIQWLGNRIKEVSKCTA